MHRLPLISFVLATAVVGLSNRALAGTSTYGTNFIVTDLGNTPGSSDAVVFPTLGDAGQIMYYSSLATPTRYLDFDNQAACVEGPGPISRNGLVVSKQGNPYKATMAPRANNCQSVHPTSLVPATYTASLGRGVNGAGKIVLTVGVYDTPNDQWNQSRVYLRSADGSSYVNIYPLPTDSVIDALGMNEGETIVGLYNPTTNPSDRQAERAFRWTASGGLMNLGTLPGGSRSRAFDVNAPGRAVGWATNSSGAIRPVTWSASGVIYELPILSGDTSGAARDVDDCGVIVGESTGASGTRGVRWRVNESNGEIASVVLSDLNAEFHSGSGLVLARAVEINSQGWIVGIGYESSAPTNLKSILLRPNQCPYLTCRHDLSGNGQVDMADITEILIHWLEYCP